MDKVTLLTFPSPAASKAACRVDVLAGWSREEMRAFTVRSTPEDDDEMEKRFAALACKWAAKAAYAGRQAWLYRFGGAPVMALGASNGA